MQSQSLSYSYKKGERNKGDTAREKPNYLDVQMALSYSLETLMTAPKTTENW